MATSREPRHFIHPMHRFGMAYAGTEFLVLMLDAAIAAAKAQDMEKAGLAASAAGVLAGIMVQQGLPVLLPHKLRFGEIAFLEEDIK